MNSQFLSITIPDSFPSSPCLACSDDSIQKIREKICRYRWAQQGYASLQRIAGHIYEPCSSGQEDGWKIPPLPPLSARGRQLFLISWAQALLGYLDNDEAALESAWTTLEKALTRLDGLWWQPASFLLVNTADALLPRLDNDRRKQLQQYLQHAMAIAPHQQAGGNIGAGSRAAFIYCGFLLNDRNLVDHYINDANDGILPLIDRCLLHGGIWAEMAPSYHLYALLKIFELAWVCKRLGFSIEKPLGGRIEQACSVYLSLVDSQLEPPHTADTWTGPLAAVSVNATDHISPQRRLFELAYSLYEDPRIGWLLRQTPRETIDTLAFGIPELKSQTPSSASVCYPAAGIACLRAGDRDTFWGSERPTAFLRFGPDAGWHGHRDALTLEFRALGADMLWDPGRSSRYADVTNQKFFRYTVAHPTVTVDCRSQQGNPQGECLSFIDHEKISAIAAVCPNLYPGVSCSRSVMLTESCLVDHFRLISDDEHRYHYTLYGDVGIHDLPAALTPGCLPGAGDGYGFMSDCASGPVSAPFSFTMSQGVWDDNGEFQPGATGMRVFVLSRHIRQMSTFFVPVGAQSEWVSGAHFRQGALLESIAKDQDFLTVMVPYRNQVEIEGAQCIDSTSGTAVRLDYTDGRKAYLAFGSGKPVNIEHDNLSFAGELLYLCVDENGNPKEAFVKKSTCLSLSGKELFSSTTPSEWEYQR